MRPPYTTRRTLLTTTLAFAIPSRPCLAQFDSELQAFKDADRGAPSADASLLFVGSSTIRLWPDLEATFAPRPVVRRGFGGATLADVLAARAILFDAHRPAAVVLYAGENDVADGAAPEIVVARFEELRRALAASAAGRAPLVFINLKPSPARFSQWPAMDAVNTAIAALSGTLRPAAVVRTEEFVLGTDGTPDPAMFVADGLHFSAEGYAHLTAAVGAALDRVLG